MTTPDFDALFSAASLEMKAAFLRSASGNRPDEKGAPREQQVKSFLKDWLPEKYGISKGYILNPEKKVSKECDIVIFNSETCPKFFFSKEVDVRFFPKNEVYFTFEIKSTLNGDELNNALSKIASVKEMTNSLWPAHFNGWEHHDAKIAMFEREDEDDEYPSRRRKKHRLTDDDYTECSLQFKQRIQKFSETYCGIFAYKGGNDDLFTLRDKLQHIEHQPELVVILDQGVAG